MTVADPRAAQPMPQLVERAPIEAHSREDMLLLLADIVAKSTAKPGARHSKWLRLPAPLFRRAAEIVKAERLAHEQNNRAFRMAGHRATVDGEGDERDDTYD